MFDFDKLDKLIHERGRLGIMTLLATRPSWSFQDLKSELKMSDGNLITHLRALHDAGLRQRIIDGFTAERWIGEIWRHVESLRAEVRT